MNSVLKSALVAVAVIAAAIGASYLFYNRGHELGYHDGYRDGYNIGYSAGYTDKGKLSENSVKTETKVVYQKIPYTGADVQLETPPPTVTVSVNGKKQEVVQHQETADLQVKTETDVKLKIPERRWTVGLGTDGRRAAYMLKAPVKGAVGLWIAGSGKSKVMGGVTVSF